MLTKKQIIKIYEDKHKVKVYPATVCEIHTGVRYAEIDWKNKLTEFKMKVKEFDENNIIPLNYKQVWDLLEGHLL